MVDFTSTIVVVVDDDDDDDGGGDDDYDDHDGGDDDDVGDDDVCAFVPQQADEDTRRAMVKSYQTSGGTVLSTNWDEVIEANDKYPQDACTVFSNSSIFLPLWDQNVRGRLLLSQSVKGVTHLGRTDHAQIIYRSFPQFMM